MPRINRQLMLRLQIMMREHIQISLQRLRRMCISRLACQRKAKRGHLGGAKMIITL